MDRRQLLRVSGLAVVTGLAGCLDDGSTGEQTGADPTTTAGGTATGTTDPTATERAAYQVPIRNLWSAYENENVTGMRASYHSESPYTVSESEVRFGNEISATNFSVVDRTDGNLTVAVEATVTEGDQTQSVEHAYELRREDGHWAIWRFVVGSPAALDDADSGGQGETDAPAAAFGFDYDGSATGNGDTGVLTITHSGGDAIDATTLSVRGDGIVDPADASAAVTASGTTWASATGEETVTAGTSVTVGVASDCDVRLVWEAPDGGMSVTLAQYDGPDA
ncbi:hypothetical protein [Haloarcula onubensis]|uniref:Type IV pilin N-terminal domain-containing protein n=1 Tax=Haloarcula onubensis TaxID=2950539 RepID=A0ABU2FRA6_9EURY|nr:hypothetical protein [Halomicroarcula sp. S3CR25-11]MDS0283293.1 type IV pilin N-terminal domain-containing protein [Halomicroarcula sp. S3CR25-11]